MKMAVRECKALLLRYLLIYQKINLLPRRAWDKRKYKWLKQELCQQERTVRKSGATTIGAKATAVGRRLIYAALVIKLEEDAGNRRRRLLPVAAAAATTPFTMGRRTGTRPRIRALPLAATWPRCTLKPMQTPSTPSSAIMEPALPGSASPTAWRKAPSYGRMGAQTATMRIGRAENQTSGAVSEHTEHRSLSSFYETDCIPI